MIGTFDETSARFQVETAFEEVDQGFEFYAPQTLVAPDGRRIMWGWAGMMTPEREAAVPTIDTADWVHVLTVPRELHVNTNLQLVQQPIQEILSPTALAIHEVDHLTPGQYRVQTAADWSVALGEYATLKREGQTLYFKRHQWENETIDGRQITGDIDDLLLIVDNDVIEVYTEDGLQVMTGRYF